MKTQTFKKIELTDIIKHISSHANIGRLDEAGVPQTKKPKPQEEDPVEKEPVAPPAQPKADQSAPEPVAPPAQDVPPADASQQQDSPPATQDSPEQQPAPEQDVNSQAVADSEVDQAEQEIEQPSFVKLNSDSGIKFLLNAILQPAVETNTLDSIAQDFIEKLKINSPDDFQKFKGETIQFRGVSGFNQLISSMENFIA